jgi:hypothetical protein
MRCGWFGGMVVGLWGEWWWSDNRYLPILIKTEPENFTLPTHFIGSINLNPQAEALSIKSFYLIISILKIFT